MIPTIHASVSTSERDTIYRAVNHTSGFLKNVSYFTIFLDFKESFKPSISCKDNITASRFSS